jgi:hypothetical protein
MKAVFERCRVEDVLEKWINSLEYLGASTKVGKYGNKLVVRLILRIYPREHLENKATQRK